jgi:hypothetical protein
VSEVDSGKALPEYPEGVCPANVRNTNDRKNTSPFLSVRQLFGRTGIKNRSAKNRQDRKELVPAL